MSEIISIFIQKLINIKEYEVNDLNYYMIDYPTMDWSSNKIIQEAINMRCPNNKLNSLVYLLNYDNDLSLMLYAITNNNFELVKYLYNRDNKTNIETNKHMIFRHALIIGNYNILKFLLEIGIDLQGCFMKFYHKAFCKTRKLSYLEYYIEFYQGDDLTSLFLKNNSDPYVFAKENRKIPFVCICAYKNYTVLLQAFLEYGIDVNTKDPNNLTPLHLCFIYNRDEILKIIMNNNPDINVYADKEHDFFTPFHYACIYGTKWMIQYFIDNMNELPEFDKKKIFSININTDALSRFQYYLFDKNISNETLFGHPLYYLKYNTNKDVNSDEIWTYYEEKFNVQISKDAMKYLNYTKYNTEKKDKLFGKYTNWIAEYKIV